MHQVFFTPAILSAPPILVEEGKIIAINGLLDSTFAFSNILGAVISVFLLNIIDINNLILLCSIMIFFAFLLQLKLKTISAEKGNGEEGNNSSMRLVLKKYKDIASMLSVFLVFNIVMTPIFVLIPWYLENVYRGNATGLSLIEGGLGAGALITGLIVSSYKLEVSDKNRVRMISFICFIFGVLFLLFSQSTHSWQAMLIMFLVGGASSFLNIQIITFFQVRANIEDVPSIMALVNLISNASVPISLTMSGLIFPYVSIPKFTFVLSIAVIVLSVTLTKFISGENNELSK